MKHFFATSAVALLALGPAAHAQTATTADPGMGYLQAYTEGEAFASDLIGMDIYATADEVDAAQPATADMRAGWEDIGEINDLLVSEDGQVRAVLVDVGGFLGMGEHTVAVEMSRVHMMSDDTGARFAAITASRESLEAAPAFERPEPMAPPAGTDTMGAAPAVAPTATDTTGTMAADPAAGFTAPEGYMPLATQELTAERLDGASIYGEGDATIGTIAELVLDPSGQVTQAVVDVGGFLGIGAHTVALDFSELNVVNNPETGEVRVYSSATREQLEQMPEYQG